MGALWVVAATAWLVLCSYTLSSYVFKYVDTPSFGDELCTLFTYLVHGYDNTSKLICLIELKS